MWWPLQGSPGLSVYASASQLQSSNRMNSEVNVPNNQARDEQSKTRQKCNHDSKRAPFAAARRPRDSEGEVQEEVVPQSYIVESEGDTICRNRRDLIRLPADESVPNSSEPEEWTESNDSHNTQPHESSMLQRVRKSSRQSPTTRMARPQLGELNSVNSSNVYACAC